MLLAGNKQVIGSIAMVSLAVAMENAMQPVKKNGLEANTDDLT